MAFTAPAQDRLTPRSAATRAKLISVAERLFAERGIEGVSLSEIGRAAGQSNAAVCQYHFGNKDGLIQAIIDKHTPGIAARRYAMLEALRQAGAPGLRDTVKAFIHPVAEKLFDPDGGGDFIRITAQLVAMHTLSVQRLSQSPFRLPAGGEAVGAALEQALAGLRLPAPILQQRTMLAAVLLFHGLADHLRMRAAAGSGQAVTDTGLLVANLEDAMVAMLAAPVSAETRQAYERTG